MSDLSLESKEKSLLETIWSAISPHYCSWFDTPSASQKKKTTSSKIKIKKEEEDDDNWFSDVETDMNKEYNGGQGKQALLGKYSLKQLEKVKVDYGIQDALARRGLKDNYITMDTSDDFVHKLYIWMGDSSNYGSANNNNNLHADNLLVELVLKRVRDVYSLKNLSQLLTTSTTTSNNKPSDKDNNNNNNNNNKVQREGRRAVMKLMQLVAGSDQDHHPDFIIIEWMRMQDPRPQAQTGIKLLPGQEKSPLGIGREFSECILKLAISSKRDAVVNIPLYFHNAWFYHRNGHLFMNPVVEGIFCKLCADIDDVYEVNGLHALANAVLYGQLFYESSGVACGRRRVKWVGEEMMQPISSRMREYANSKDYLTIKDDFSALLSSEKNFIVDFEAEMATETDWKDAIPIFSIDTTL